MSKTEGNIKKSRIQTGETYWGRAPQLTLTDAEALGYVEERWRKDVIEDSKSKAQREKKSLMILTSEPSVQCCKNIKYDFRPAGHEARKEDSFPNSEDVIWNVKKLRV